MKVRVTYTDRRTKAPIKKAFKRKTSSLPKKAVVRKRVAKIDDTEDFVNQFYNTYGGMMSRLSHK